MEEKQCIIDNIQTFLNFHNLGISNLVTYFGFKLLWCLALYAPKDFLRTIHVSSYVVHAARLVQGQKYFP